MMSDTRAAMREFRFLDDKRKQGRLEEAEEYRWQELRQQLGFAEEPAYDPNQQQWAAQQQQQPQGYWGQDGQWYPYDPQQYQQWYAQQQAQGYDPNAWQQ